ncbi:MAG: nitrile hydratase subunit alpha [Rhodospirillales bacterium]|nr:nitrile hydratase subunit alpha [Rhodospirillales bacterium]
MSDSHSHDHDHDHDHLHNPHGPHPYQPDLEDAPFTHCQLMAEAVGELLIEKDVFSADDLRAMIELIDSKSPAEGARLIARAWLDADFKARVLENVNDAATELGIDAGTIPIRAVENTDTVHNVIVCTLCSCYPRLLIGLPPDWYKSRSYRSRAVREPRTVLKEFGTHIDDNIEVRVHDSTADLRYLVIPERPQGSETMSEDELTSLVTRDSMIGVTTL